MSLEAKREYIASMWILYQGLKLKSEKSEVLDALCLTLEIHRKAATRLMRKKTVPQLRRYSGSRKERYTKESRRWFVHFWLQMGRMSAPRMKAALPEWLAKYFGSDLSRSLRAELRSLSPTTMDRILKPIRAQIKRRLNTGTRQSKHIALVPLRPLGEKIDSVGHIEVDTVAHHGDSMSGLFAWTVTMTDLYSGWTCARAVLGKSAKEVVAVISEMEHDFPFPIKALYSDCGTEFINETMIETFKNRLENAIELYRSRPYKKNDQAHVEQKNFTFVRQLFGYTRVENARIVEKMNEIYKQQWQPLNNFYLPQTKTESKIRVGSKVKRKMSKPVCPVERILDNNQVGETVKGQLLEEKLALNPWVLKDDLKKAMHKLWRHFVIYNRWTGDIGHAS